MRAVAVLTAIEFVLVLFVGTGAKFDAGQTLAHKPSLQERTLNAQQLIAQYDALANKPPPKLRKRKITTCKDAEKAIIYYRNKVWHYQYLLGERKSTTKYQERLKNACPYKRWVAKNWRGIARAYTEELKRIKANPYKLARMIVYSIFPKETAEGALTVVDCETGGTYDESATNRTSGVRGYFQIHPGNHGRVFYWRGKKLVLDASRLYDPWYNTLVAVFMTSGGKHWHEWHCQPYRGIG